jgi:hypothetical protein
MKPIRLGILLLAFAITAMFGVHAFAQSGGEAGVAAIKNLDGCNVNNIPANDDGSTGLVTLPFTLDFFGTNYSQLYVNNNGNVTFDAPQITYTPYSLLSTTHVIIAPFFADVDTRSGPLTTYGSTTYSGHPTFCVNWLGVGYFSQHTDKTDSFQLLLIDRSDIGPGDFDIMMNYNQIQWETGDASGGTGGLGGASARVGYSNGTTTQFELPGSAVNGAFLDSASTGLAHNSRDSFLTGRYLYPVRNGGAPTGGSISGHVFSPGSVAKGGALVQLCRTGGGCNTTATNSTGEYSISGLAADTYNGTAFPPAHSDLFPGTAGPVNLAEGAALTGIDFTLRAARPVPPGVTVGGFWTNGAGTPVLNWSASATISKVNCPGGTASFEVRSEGVVIASGPMPESPAGTYTGTIPPLHPHHGPAVITITVTCPNSAQNKTVEVDVYIDPSGTVRNTIGDPISGATVTLERSDSSSGPFVAVPTGDAIMSPSNRTNPDMSNAQGAFHWDVIAGYYKVRAEKTGCHDSANASISFVESAVLTIPPPATDLVLTLRCGETGPTATPTPQGLLGDGNCNGTVNSIDASLVLQYTAGLIQTLACLQLADVNHSGSVNSIDASLILQYTAGLILHF